MKAVSKPVQTFLARTIAGLELGEYRRWQAPGYMPLVLERIGADLFSLAHYGEQNGDLMRDPDVVFWRGSDERYYPVSFRNDYTGTDVTCVEFEAAADGTRRPVRLAVQRQRDLASFCSTWYRNIREQDHESFPQPT